MGGLRKYLENGKSGGGGGGSYVKFPPWWGYGYFLEPHNTKNSTCRLCYCCPVIVWLLLGIPERENNLFTKILRFPCYLVADIRGILLSESVSGARCIY